MGKILAQDRAVGVCDLAAQNGDYLIIHLIFSDIPEGLDEGAAFPARRGHVPGGSVLEEDFPLSDPDLARGAVGKKNDAGGNLIRQAEHVGSISPGGLDSNRVSGHQCTRDRIGRRSNDSEDGILRGIVVKPPRELPDRARSLESA